MKGLYLTVRTCCISLPIRLKDSKQRKTDAMPSFTTKDLHLVHLKIHVVRFKNRYRAHATWEFFMRMTEKRSQTFSYLLVCVKDLL